MTDPSTSGRAVAVGIACLAAVVVGLALGVSISRLPVPSELGSAELVASMPVVAQSFADERTVELVAGQTSERGIVTRASGIVTYARCVRSESITPGETNFAVNGQPLLNLQMDFPLWRDLSVSDSGPDVAVIQRSLQSLGYPLEADGDLGPATLAAYRAAMAAIGSNVDLVDTISSSEILWMPPGATMIEECLSAVGDEVSAGTVLMRLPPFVSEIAVRGAPEDLVAGDRTISVEGVQVPTDASGRVTDAASLSALTSTEAYLSHAADPEGTTFKGSYALATAVDAYRIPPSAIFGIDGGEACVSTGDRTVKGQLLGAELGYTLMALEERVDVVDLRPGNDRPCP